MKENVIIGIDVSKATLDICIFPEKKHQVIKNEVQAIKRFLKRYGKKDLHIGVENTGRYNWALYEAVGSLPLKLYVLNPLHLKRSFGLVRGKTDKDDAFRIAQFVQKNINELTPWEPVSDAIQKLQILLSNRTQRIKILRQLTNASCNNEMLKKLELEVFEEGLESELIGTLKGQIKQIEKEIKEVLKNDLELQKKSQLLLSVPGVGEVLTWNLLVKTNAFKKINTPRKLACYCGVAPFDFQSGTSIKKKPRVSSYADKTLKSILHMGAMSAIKTDPSLSQYYNRKVMEGKNKMSVLNAVRNKIIHRIMAVIKNGKDYQISLVMS